MTLIAGRLRPDSYESRALSTTPRKAPPRLLQEPGSAHNSNFERDSPFGLPQEPNFTSALAERPYNAHMCPRSHVRNRRRTSS